LKNEKSRKMHFFDFFEEKFAKGNLFIVSLQRIS